MYIYIPLSPNICHWGLNVASQFDILINVELRTENAFPDTYRRRCMDVIIIS